MSLYSWVPEPTPAADENAVLKTAHTEQNIPYPEQSPPQEDSDGTNVDILDVCEEAFHDVQDDAMEDEAHPDFALELNELKQLVEGRGPASVLDLHLNIVRILDSTVRAPGRAREEMRSYYLQVIREVFPWFDPSQPAQFWTEWQPNPSTLPPPSRQYR